MPDDDPIEIHKGRQPRRPHFLKEWMEARGVTNRDLINELGVDKSLVSRWLKGTTPNEEWQAKLRAYFEASEEYGIFRRPEDDWMTRFFADRSREEIERIKSTLETAFPKEHRKSTRS